MQRVRTVTVSLTPLMSDIISEVVDELAPIDIIARFDRSEHLALCLKILAPDLVLIALAPDEGDDIALTLSKMLPRAKVIALSHDVRHAYVHLPSRHCSAPIGISPTALIEAIRGY